MELRGLPPAAQPPFRPGFGSDAPQAPPLGTSSLGLAVRVPFASI